MAKFLVIAGISGTGKSVLREKLANNYPDKFYICPQVTTRPIRDGESIYNYVFLPDKFTYDLLESRLVGKTEVNGNHYGSLFTPEEERIGIIILNEEGLLNFLKFKQNSNDIFSISIGLDKNIENLTVTREGRDEEFLKQERKVLELCDYTIKLNKEWADPKKVLDICEKAFSEEQNVVSKWCENN